MSDWAIIIVFFAYTFTHIVHSLKIGKLKDRIKELEKGDNDE